MNKDEQISVIVPVHNGQAYLEKCIESIETQTYGNLEVLIMNDGSTDNTGAVCEKLQSRYGNVRVTTLEDVGVSKARNLAIEQAQGEYLMFVDADDRLKADTLRILYEVIQETAGDMAGCRFQSFHREEELLAEDAGQAGCSWKKSEYDGREYLAESILGKNNCRCWSKLYRKSFVGDIRFRENLTIGEDMLFLMDLVPRIHKAVEITYPGYLYYQNLNGAMQRPFSPAYMDQIRCWELAKEDIRQSQPELLPQVEAKLMVAILLTIGKLALLPSAGRKENQSYLTACKEKLQKQNQESTRTVRQYLPGGYRMKTTLFAACPGGYVRVYGFLQRMKNRWHRR